MNVSLTPELDRFVGDRVEAGRYATASEVVREGLRLLQRHERDRETAHAALKRRLEEAARQADAGELVDPDALLDAVDRRRRMKNVTV